MHLFSLTVTRGRRRHSWSGYWGRSISWRPSTARTRPKHHRHPQTQAPRRSTSTCPVHSGHPQAFVVADMVFACRVMRRDESRRLQPPDPTSKNRAQQDLLNSRSGCTRTLCTPTALRLRRLTSRCYLFCKPANPTETPTATSTMTTPDPKISHQFACRARHWSLLHPRELVS